MTELVMKEIESDDALWQTRNRKRAEKAQRKLEQEARDRSAASQESMSTIESPQNETTGQRRPGFY